MVTSEEAEAQKAEVIFSGLFCQLGAKLELNLKSDDHNPMLFLLHHICYHLEHQECITATTGEQHHHRMKCRTGLIYREGGIRKAVVFGCCSWGVRWKLWTAIKGPKITADGDCSHEIKRCLLLGRKAMTNLDGILKSRDFTLPTKVHLVKAMVFPVVIYGYETWTIKKAEWQRTDAFELWCWRRLLRVPWTSRRSNQSILKEISPQYSLKEDWCWSSNTLATWCEELTPWKRPWSWERLKVGEGDDRG